VDVDSLTAVIEGVLKEHREKDAEERRCKDSALLHSAANWEGLGGCAIVADGAAHVFMEGPDHSKQVWWASNLPQQAEYATSADQIKCLCEVAESYVHWHPLFLAFLLKLA
jgi:hypothetical protein